MNIIRITVFASLLAACSDERRDLPDTTDAAETTPDGASETAAPETLDPIEVTAETLDDILHEDTPEVSDSAELDTLAPVDTDAADTIDAPELRTCERLAPPEPLVGQPLGTTACNVDEACDPSEVFVPDFVASFTENAEPGLVGDGYRVDAEDFSYGMIGPIAPAGGMESTVEIAFNMTDARTNACLLAYDGRTYLSISSIGLSAHGYGAVDGELMSATIPLSGLPPRAWEPYTDGAWHHIAMTTDARTGRMRFYLDGVTSPELEVANAPIDGLAAFDWIGYGVGCSGWLFDEVAYYPRVLPSALIAEHAAAVRSGQPYPTQSTCGPVPCAPHTYDTRYIPEEFPFTGDDGLPTQDALTQLADYPLPRYRDGNTLQRLESWVQALWLSADNDLETDAHTADSRAVRLMQTFALDWNYYFDVTHAGCLGIEYDWCLEVVAPFIEAHPDIPILMQTHGVGADSGPHMAKERPACPSGLNPLWSPATFYDIAYDFYVGWVSLAKDRLGRSLDLIVEDGETWWEGRQWGGPPLDEAVLMDCAETDPEVMAVYQRDYLDQGLTARHMWTDAFTGWRLAWNDALRDLNGDPDTDILWYGIDGHSDWNAGDWGLGARDVQMSTRPQTFDDQPQRYSSIDFYPGYYAFDRTLGPRHGLDWVFDARSGEIAAGDHLAWPFVSAGWTLEEYVIRPGMWLGLLKVLAGLGAESYHSGYFAYPPHSPGGDWVWHGVVPAYAQAVTSHWEDLLRSSVVASAGLAKNPRHAFAVRQVLGPDRAPQRKWVIIGNVNRFENTADTLYSKDSVLEVRVGDETLRVPIRMQGSTYVYDATGPEPTLVQLDAWHEWTHPSWWSKDFAFEAEAADAGTGRVVTRWPAAPAAEIRDGVGAVTMREMGVGDRASFAFEPRDATRFEPWARIETTGPATLLVRVGEDERVLVVPHAQVLRWTQLGDALAIPRGRSALEVEVIAGSLAFDAMRLVVEGGPTRCE